MYYRVLDTQHKAGNWSKAMERHWIVFSNDPKKFDTHQTELFPCWSWAHEDPDMEREPCIGQCSHIGRCKPVKKEELPKKVYDAFMVFLSDNPWKETEFKEC
jgi:hypothetical protein